MAMIPVVNEHKIIHFSSAISKVIVNPVKNPYTFRSNYNQSFMSHGILDYAVKNKGFTRLAMLLDNCPLGKVVEKEHETRLANKYGLEPVIKESYSVGDLDMTAQLLKIKRANVQGVLVGGMALDGARVVKNWKKVGMGDIWMLGQDFFSPRTFRSRAGEPIDLCVSAMPRNWTYAKGGRPGKRQVEYLEKMMARYGEFEDVFPSSGNYDSIYYLAEAIRRADSTNPEKLKAALETIKNFDGVACTGSFSRDDHEAYTPADTTIAYPWRKIMKYGKYGYFFERVPDAP
jgi:branched-chain amino acid transport system substrate-binding protein